MDVSKWVETKIIEKAVEYWTGTWIYGMFKYVRIDVIRMDLRKFFFGYR